MTPVDSQPAGGTRPGREPPRWWTLPVPCMLTLPVSAWCLLVALLAGFAGSSADNGSPCFDNCGLGEHWINAVAAVEFILGVTTVVTLIAGLASPAWRRKLRRVIWIAGVLAWLGGGLVYYWASRTQ